MKILTRDDTEHGVEYVTLADAEKEIQAWKANHDNQVELKRIIASRPDLAERAPMVERLVSERNAAIRAKIEAIRLLKIFRECVPLGNQPHMLAAEVDNFVSDNAVVGAPATAPQSIIGYRLEDGPEKMECFFLPDRPQKKTLDTIAVYLKAGWIITEVIRLENATRKP